MIDSIELSNYRSLDSGVRVELGPLTVLVGPNAAGKSNFLDGLAFLSDSMRLGLEGAVAERHGIHGVRRWSKGRPFNVTFRVGVKRADFSGDYSFVLTGDQKGEYRVGSEKCTVRHNDSQSDSFEVRSGEWVSGPEGVRPEVHPQSLALQLLSGDKRFRPLADDLRSIAVYSIFPDTLRTPQRYNPSKPMAQHGDNWMSILKDQAEHTWKPDLGTALERLSAGDIVDIRPSRVNEFLIARFLHRIENNQNAKNPKRKWFDSAQESDGTLRIAGILTALLQQPPLSLVGIEEPELTVHPGIIPVLLDYIREASEGTQVIITTHSPDLLDLTRSEEVRVVEKRGGSTTIRPMAESQRQLVREGLMSLGEVLRVEGLQQALFE